jgi:hypothetical protein
MGRYQATSCSWFGQQHSGLCQALAPPHRRSPWCHSSSRKWCKFGSNMWRAIRIRGRPGASKANAGDDEENRERTAGYITQRITQAMSNGGWSPGT